MRTFERTHPWITFRINLEKAPPKLWLALGEAASKCEHIARVPLRPSTAKRLHQLYLAKGVAATTAIEGNTLSEEDVLRAVQGDLTVLPSKSYLKQEVENIIEACNTIGKQIGDSSLPVLSRELLCVYNAQILKRVPLVEGAVPGEIRSHSVVVGNAYRGAPAQDCPYLLDTLFAWLEGKDFRPQVGMETVFAIIKAVLTHLYLAWIHPFGDGNGRVARLVELHILLSAGVPSPAAHLLSNHYNQTRSEYYRQLDYASKSGGDVLPFIAYAVQGFVDGLKEQLETIWDQQWDITWENMVHDLFRSQTSPGDQRRRRLALEFGKVKDAVKINQITDLTPELARLYAAKTSKTLSRDLNALADMNLIIRESGRIRACRELILAFLPLRHPQAED